MADEQLNVLIIGFGAIGTIYGYILSQNKNVQVTAVARSAAAAMNEHGIDIESDKFGQHNAWKPHRIVSDSQEANDRPYRFIILATKCLPDLIPSASILAPFLDGPFGKKPNQPLSHTPTVVLIQNGIGIEHPVQLDYPETPIVSAVAWIGTNLLKEDGKVTVTHGMLENLIIGVYEGEGHRNEAPPIDADDYYSDPAGYYDDEQGEERLEYAWTRCRQFEMLLRQGGGSVQVKEDIQVPRWEKLLWNAAWSSMCAMSRAPLSQVVDPAILPYTLPAVRRTMLEVIYIAREWGFTEQDLPNSLVDQAIKITISNYQVKGAMTPATPAMKGSAFAGYGFPGPENGTEVGGDDSENTNRSTSNFKPSMLLDLESGRPMELEPLIGSLLDRARAKGVATPRLDLCYATLKVGQDIALRQAASTPEIKEHLRKWFLRKPSVAGPAEPGRKIWEKAVRNAEKEGAQATGKVIRKGKVTGQPVKARDE